jgi:hypothetical protein
MLCIGIIVSSLSLIYTFRSDFAAPQRIIEPLKNSVNVSGDNEPLTAPSLKVLDPPSSLRRLADYRKKMMIDLEGSVVLAPMSESERAVSRSAPEEPVSSGTSHEIPETQLETKSEPPNSPLSLTLVSDPCEPAPLPSNARKLNLEFVAVRLPTPILEPSKDSPELQDAEILGPESSDKPEVAIRVSISTPPSASVASNIIDSPVPLPLEEPAVCSDIVVRSIGQGYPEADNMLGSPVDVAEVVKLAASPLTILADKNVSPKVSGITSKVPGSRKSLLFEAASKNNTGLLQKANHATKSPRRKPVVVSTENPLTNYFKPVSITLTADDGEIDSSKNGGARTIHLSIESSDSSENIAMPIVEPGVCLQSLETVCIPQETIAKHAEPDTCLQSSDTDHIPQEIISKNTEILEDSEVPSVTSVEILASTKENGVECEVSEWREILSPVKVVVEKIEDFILTKTFSALETTPPLNAEHNKELPSREVSSSRRRKTKSPLKRNPGDPKLPPFKSENRTVQHTRTKEQCMEAMSEDKVPKSSSRHNKRTGKEGMTPSKRSSRSESGRQSGNMMGKTGGEAIPGPETASGDNTSPSLLAAVSGRMSRSKSNHMKSQNPSSEVVENNEAQPRKGELTELSATESHCKPPLHSRGILDNVKANRRNSRKSRKPLSIKDLNECGQVKIDENDSLLVCSKEKALVVEISKQNDNPSKANVQDVSGDACEGDEPSDSANIETVEVEVHGENVLNSGKATKLHVEVSGTPQKSVSQTASNDVLSRSRNKEEKTRGHSTFDNGKSFDLNSEDNADGVPFTKQDISDCSGALNVSTRKLLVTDTEGRKERSSDSLRQAYEEISPNDVKISESSTSANCNFIEVGTQKDTIPHLGTSVDMVTSKEESHTVVKTGCSNVTEQTAGDRTSHANSNSLTSSVNVDEEGAKSVFSEMKNDPRIEEACKLEAGDGARINSNVADPEPSVKYTESTSKMKSCVVLLENVRKGTNQEEPVDNLDCQTARTAEADTSLSSEGLGAEGNDSHATEVECGERKRMSVHRHHSLLPTEDVYTKSRRRKHCGMGRGNDLKTVRISSERSESSELQQGCSDNTVTESNCISLLEEVGENSTIRSPEACAALTVTTTAEENTIFNVTKTAPVLTSAETPAVPVPVLTSVESVDTPSEISILPTSVEKATEPVHLCTDRTIKEGTSEKLSTDVGSLCKEENFVEKVVPRQRTRHSAINKDRPVLGVMSHRLRSSGSKLDKNIKRTSSHDAVSPKMTRGIHVAEVKAKKRVDTKRHISDHPKELGNQSSVEVSDVDNLTEKHVTDKEGKMKQDLKASSDCEDTISCVSESEVIPSCVEIPSASTGPEGAQAGSQKVSESQDVIESSQESSSSSSFIVPRFPSIHKCSVSVCRINTSLESGGKIDISQGDRKIMVVIPPDSGSPFKVYSPGKRSLRAIQEESEGAGGEMDDGHHTKLLSATRSLYGKCDVLNRPDSVQDKPGMPLDTNSSRGESIHEPAFKVRKPRSTRNMPTTRNDIPKQTYRKRKCEDGMSNVAGTGVAKPRSKKSVGIITIKECVPAASSDGAPRARSRRQSSATKPEVRFAVINVDGPPKPERRKSNTENCVDVPAVMDETTCTGLKNAVKQHGTQHEVAHVTVNNCSDTVSKKQFDKSRLVDNKQQDLLKTVDSKSAPMREVIPGTSHKMSEVDVSTVSKDASNLVKEGSTEPRSKHQINVSVCEDDVAELSSEDTSELQLKIQTNIPRSENGISSVRNETALKSQSSRQINASVCKVNVSVANDEDTPEPHSKRQINVSQSENNVSAFDDVDTPKLRSKNKINTSKSEDISTVDREDAPKFRCRQQPINTSVPEGSIPEVDTEDTQTFQSKQRSNTSKCDDSAVRSHEEGTPKPRPKQQIDISVPADNVATLSGEDAPGLLFRLQINASESGDDVLKVGKKGNLKSWSKQQDETLLCEGDATAGCSEEAPKLRSRQQHVTSKSDDSVLAQKEEGNMEPQCIQQISASDVQSSLLSAVEEDTQKPQSTQEINTPTIIEDGPKHKENLSITASECDSMPLKESVPKRRSKRKIPEDCVSTAVKKGKRPSAKQSCIQGSEVISLTDAAECKLKHPVHTSRCNSAVGSDIPTSQPKQQADMSKAEVRHISVMEDDASRPEQSSTVREDNFTVCVKNDAVELRQYETDRNKKMSREPEVKDLVLQLGSEKVNREEPLKGKAQQHSVQPKRVGVGRRRAGRVTRTKEKNVLKPDDKTSNADGCSLALQKINDKSDCTDNAPDISKAPELKETRILKGDFLQSCKRLADTNPTVLEFHNGKADSCLVDRSDTGGTKPKRMPQNAENVHPKSMSDCSPVCSPSRVKFRGDRDVDGTPSPPSKSIQSSPSSFLQAFSSPLRSRESNQNHRGHHRLVSGGRAQYLVGLAVAVKDVETTQALSPVPPRQHEEARNNIVAESSSLPLSRKMVVYGMSNGSPESGVSPPERQVPLVYV